MEEVKDVAPPADHRPEPDLRPPAVEVPVSHLLPKKERSAKQIAAFERMRARREESRLGASHDHQEQSEKEKKSVAEAAAMFMEMRRKEKETKKEMAWEKLLNETVTRRMDEFENRMVDLFNEPVERYVEKRKRKTTIPEQQLEKVETKAPDIKEPVKEVEKEFIPKKLRTYHANKQNPFIHANRKQGGLGGRGN